MTMMDRQRHLNGMPAALPSPLSIRATRDTSPSLHNTINSIIRTIKARRSNKTQSTMADNAPKKREYMGYEVADNLALSH